ncbi:SidA/IucD/PvdA family monooxygenase [Salinisphaera sp. T31B1]|uniref:lysine N(6)-hydroxylase/L-ornithine N(5)-oxygenase family protein n=1 Tax=Salinisphaera sp. T31B1 TaxID=727963 RepID=UPI00333F638A
MAEPIHDLLGVGIGPFNLGLACLAEPLDDLDTIFVDENPAFDWHPGLLIEGATLQTPFLADLVTLADPTSPYSFLNYLKQTGRLYAFYIRESFSMLRAEYNRYCRWVCERLPSLVFDARVTDIEYDGRFGCYRVRVEHPVGGGRSLYRARRLVLGSGPARSVPECCRGLDGPVFHAADYLSHRDALAEVESITLVGSGQSAAEIFHDRLNLAGPDQRLDWFTRSPRFFAMAYDKLTLELTSPEYIDYFHGLDEHSRRRLRDSHKSLYKGISEDLSNAIFDRLYEKDVHGTANVGLQANAELSAATRDPVSGCYELSFEQTEQRLRFRHRSQALILATGFAQRVPDYLRSIVDRICWDDRGRFAVSRDYRIDHGAAAVFVQNAELHTHGFSASDLGMACYRNAVILQAVTGVAHYPIERRIAFQHFDAHAHVAQPANGRSRA